MRGDKDYIDISKTFKAFRNCEKRLTEEKEKENTQDAVPYTQQDEILQTSLETCRAQFGAKFEISDNPMQYYPADGDVILSGVVPDLNQAKFQFRLRESSGNGCFFWVDCIQLNDETIRKMNVIYGVYKNWKQQLSTSEDIKPLSYKNQ